MTHPKQFIQGIILDVDGMLYPPLPTYGQRFGEAYWQATNFFRNNHGLSREEHETMKRSAYLEDGTAHRRLAQLCGVNEYEYFEKMFEFLGPLPVERSRETIEAFEPRKHIPMVALTSGLRSHTSHVLDALGLGFLRILDLKDTNGQLKSKGPEAWEIAAKYLNCNPRQILIAEDHLENAQQAATLGMQTVLVHHGSLPETQPNYIHNMVYKPHEIFNLPYDFPVRNL